MGYASIEFFVRCDCHGCRAGDDEEAHDIAVFAAFHILHWIGDVEHRAGASFKEAASNAVVTYQLPAVRRGIVIVLGEYAEDTLHQLHYRTHFLIAQGFFGNWRDVAHHLNALESHERASIHSQDERRSA